MQTGTIIRRGNYWYLRYYRPTLANGKTTSRQTATKLARVSSQYPTSDSVRAAGLTGPILGPLNAGTVTSDGAIQLVDFIEHRYLLHVRESRKPSTHKGYADSFKVLKPYLGSIELQRIRTVDVQKVLDAVAKAKPRANSTLKHLKAFLSGVFGYAVRNGLISTSPTREARSPKGLKPQDVYAYSLQEVKAMRACLKEPAKTIVLVAALSGLRMGEIAGLKWSDIEGDQINVSRAIWHGDVIETKTEGSSAPIPLLPILKKALEKHRRRSRGEFVFTGNRDGKPVVMDNVKRRAIIPALKEKGLANLWHGWHAFRRGVGTNLKELGVDDLTISRILRHEGVAVTQQHYIKRIQKPSTEAMRKLEKAFLAAKY
jgi:integrase